MKTFYANVVIAVALVVSAVPALAEVALKFGVYTADKPSEMVTQFRPVLNALEAKLSEELKTPVKITMNVASSYEAGIEMISKGEVDIAQLGPVSYVQTKARNKDIEILATETDKGKKEFKGIIAVHAESPIQSLEDLKGKRFAFGDEHSTIGRYLSQQILMEHGLHAKDLSHYEYLDRHDRVGSVVASKDFDAGALKEGTFKKMVAAGSPLKALETFPNVTKPWVARAELKPEIKEAIRTALLGLKDEKALEALGQDGFTTGSDEDYAPTRKAVEMNQQFFGSTGAH